MVTQWRCKRVYEDADPDDGYRVLVDRLWPRGLSRETAHLDLWLKDVAPSPELRKWFSHRADRFVEFTERYNRELENNAVVSELENLESGDDVGTLLYGAHDPKINHAVVLASFLRSHGFSS